MTHEPQTQAIPNIYNHYDYVCLQSMGYFA